MKKEIKPTGTITDTPSRRLEYLRDVVLVVPMYRKAIAAKLGFKYFWLWSILATLTGVFVACQHPAIATIPTGLVIHYFFNFLPYAGEMQTMEWKKANPDYEENPEPRK